MKQLNVKRLTSKKVVNATLISSSTLLLAGCIDLGEEPVFFEGSDGDDVNIGGKYGDLFIGSLGADSMDGAGALTNEVRFYKSPVGVEVNLTTGSGKGGHAQGDTYKNIQNIEGSDFDDTLTGNDQDNVINGNKGADTLDGKGGVDTLGYYFSEVAVEINLATGEAKGGDAEGDVFKNFENITGSSKNDILIGNESKNQIKGNGGADVLQGAGGDDVFITRDDDIISGGTGSDKLIIRNKKVSKIEILKSENKIQITIDEFSSNINKDIVIVNSIEAYEITLPSYNEEEYGDEAKIVDMKTIWNDLGDADHAKFNNLEAEFLNWLGDDSGYNYEGM